MNKLFECADEYVRQSNWKDLALLKFCLAAIGVMIGLSIPKEKKESVFNLAGFIFILTYVPIMGKFFRICLEHCKK